STGDWRPIHVDRPIILWRSPRDPSKEIVVRVKALEAAVAAFDAIPHDARELGEAGRVYAEHWGGPAGAEVFPQSAGYLANGPDRLYFRMDHSDLAYERRDDGGMVRWRCVGAIRGDTKFLAAGRDRFFAATEGHELVTRPIDAPYAAWEPMGRCYGVSLAATADRLFTITPDLWLLARDLTPADVPWREWGKAPGHCLCVSGGWLFTSDGRRVWRRPAAADGAWTDDGPAPDPHALVAAAGTLYGFTP